MQAVTLGRARPLGRVFEGINHRCYRWHGRRHPVSPLGGGNRFPIGIGSGGKWLFALSDCDIARNGTAWWIFRCKLILLASNSVPIHGETVAHRKNKVKKNSAVSELHHEVQGRSTRKSISQLFFSSSGLLRFQPITTHIVRSGFD